jgi:hypothetical protein
MAHEGHMIEKTEIARRAYSYYVARGYENGHDQEDWTRAEADLQRERSGKTTVAPVTAPRTGTAAKSVRPRSKAK